MECFNCGSPCGPGGRCQNCGYINRKSVYGRLLYDTGIAPKIPKCSTCGLEEHKGVDCDTFGAYVNERDFSRQYPGVL